MTTPLILLNLGMIAGADPVTILAICAGDMLMIFGGFMGSVSSGHIKWLWFSLSFLIFMPIVYVSPCSPPTIPRGPSCDPSWQRPASSAGGSRLRARRWTCCVYCGSLHRCCR